MAAETANPHSPGAVRIEFSGAKPGHVPRGEEDHANSALLRGERRVVAEVVEVRPAERPCVEAVVER